MRPILHGDATSAARALMAAAPEARIDLLVRMLREAEIADRHVLETRSVHPQFGNGTLMAAARKHPLLPEPDFDNDTYAECFAIVLYGLRVWRAVMQSERTDPSHSVSK